jgi:hypothetical protein
MGKTGTGESSYSHASQALFYRQLARPARAAHHVEASRYRGRQRQLRRASGWRHTGNEKFAERIVHAHELAGGKPATCTCVRAGLGQMLSSIPACGAVAASAIAATC